MATEPDKVDSGVLGTLVTVLAFGLLATALAITALVRTEEEVLAAERSGANEAFAELRGSQEADLHLPPAYMDQAKGVVRLPIDRAMQVVVRDLRRDPESATLKPASNGAEAAAGEPSEGEAPGEGEGAPPKDAPEGAQEPGNPAPKQPAAPTAPKPPPAPKPPAPKPAAPGAPPAPAPAPAPQPAAPAPAPAP